VLVIFTGPHVGVTGTQARFALAEEALHAAEAAEKNAVSNAAVGMPGKVVFVGFLSFEGYHGRTNLSDVWHVGCESSRVKGVEILGTNRVARFRSGTGGKSS
jgi:hypothetical protein